MLKMTVINGTSPAMPKMTVINGTSLAMPKTTMINGASQAMRKVTMINGTSLAMRKTTVINDTSLAMRKSTVVNITCSAARTTVTNGTEKTLTVKKGTESIWTSEKKLKPQGSCQIVLDDSQQCWCTLTPDEPGSGVLLSLTDCLNLMEVSFHDEKDGEPTIKMVKRSGEATLKSQSSFHRYLRKLSFKNRD